MGSASSNSFLTKSAIGYIVPKGVVHSITNKTNLLKARNKGYMIYPTSDAAKKALDVMKTVGAVMFDRHGTHLQIYKWDDACVYGVGEDDLVFLDTRTTIIVPTLEEAQQYLASEHRPKVGEYVLSSGLPEQLVDPANLFPEIVTYPTLALAQRAQHLIKAKQGFAVQNGQIYRLYIASPNNVNKVYGFKDPPRHGIKIPYAQVHAFKDGNEAMDYIRYHKDIDPYLM